MRTLIIIVIGFVLLGLFLGIARRLSGNAGRALPVSFAAFAVAWAIVAGVNMWIGITEAGYSFMEELPIFLVIFLAPVVPGWFIQRRLGKTVRELVNGPSTD